MSMLRSARWLPLTGKQKWQGVRRSFGVLVGCLWCTYYYTDCLWTCPGDKTETHTTHGSLLRRVPSLEGTPRGSAEDAVTKTLSTP